MKKKKERKNAKRGGWKKRSNFFPSNPVPDKESDNVSDWEMT